MLKRKVNVIKKVITLEDHRTERVSFYRVTVESDNGLNGVGVIDYREHVNVYIQAPLTWPKLASA